MDFLDIDIYKKATKTYEATLKKDGIAPDLTGWTIYFVVKTNMSDTDTNAKIKKTITTHYNPTAGITRVELSSTDTNITVGSYYYSVEYTDVDGRNGVLRMGRFNVLQPVLARD